MTAGIPYVNTLQQSEKLSSALLPDPAMKVRMVFEQIEATRMQGLPFLNPALCVDTIGFRPWQQFWLGVILTPWTMNLLLLPRDASQWPTLPRGERQHYQFPAGVYDFIVAHDETLGAYMMCSLFSPVQQFGDHETARQTAEYVLEALFKSDAPAEPGEETPRPTLQEKIKEPLSKRDFLRGRFLRGGRDESI